MLYYVLIVLVSILDMNIQFIKSTQVIANAVFNVTNLNISNLLNSNQWSKWNILHPSKTASNGTFYNWLFRNYVKF